jgi:hypothetical protein
MSRTIILIIGILILHQVIILSSQQCTRREFKEFQGFRTINDLLYTVKTADVYGCRRACRLTDKCNGFNIRWDTSNPEGRMAQECQILKVTVPLDQVSVDGDSSFYCEYIYLLCI